MGTVTSAPGRWEDPEGIFVVDVGNYRVLMMIIFVVISICNLNKVKMIDFIFVHCACIVMYKKPLSDVFRI